MNEVFENNGLITKLQSFYINNRKLILGATALFITIISIYLINYQLTNKNNEEAAKIYNQWISQEIETDEGKLTSKKLFGELITDYKNSGYTQIAILNQASLDASDENFEDAIKHFSLLIELTNGFNGNKLFNKIARINKSRLLYNQKNYDEALLILEKYKSSSDAMIHELIGDILNKQNKFDLAKEQYLIAKDRYIDEMSISIVNMKISNID